MLNQFLNTHFQQATPFSTSGLLPLLSLSPPPPACLAVIFTGRMIIILAAKLSIYQTAQQYSSYIVYV